MTAAGAAALALFAFLAWVALYLAAREVAAAEDRWVQVALVVLAVTAILACDSGYCWT